jgi:hypothetical protein
MLAGLLAFAGAFFAGGTHSAVAPEPAKLSSGLSGSTGAIGAAVFLNTNTPTRVLYWSSSWVVTTATGGPAAGTPCSAWALAQDAITTHVIQRFASGNYAYVRCSP